MDNNVEPADAGRRRANQPMTEPGQLIRVLHVEDDPNYREALADQLAEHGFVVSGFADATSLADGLALAHDADIILLDWDLPGVSGIELLVELRLCGVNLPVAFLTGYGFTDQENLAFEKGAVDFIDKARGVEVLARRLRRLVSPAKLAAPPPANLVCGKLTLNPQVGRAYWNGSDVGLTMSEYNIVLLLASTPGRWVTYRTIYDRVHYEGFMAGSGEDGFRTNVRGIIRRLRKKFIQCDKTFAHIQNFVGIGYRWATPTPAECRPTPASPEPRPLRRRPAGARTDRHSSGGKA
jgi:two-component system response regulator ChvI